MAFKRISTLSTSLSGTLNPGDESGEVKLLLRGEIKAFVNLCLFGWIGVSSVAREGCGSVLG